MTEQTAEKEEVLTCAYRDGKKATKTVQVEGQSILLVCTPCERAMHRADKRKICQYCGIPIVNNWKKPALLGFHHSRGCPRFSRESS